MTLPKEMGAVDRDHDLGKREDGSSTVRPWNEGRDEKSGHGTVAAGRTWDEGIPVGVELFSELEASDGGENYVQGDDWDPMFPDGLEPLVPLDDGVWGFEDL
jgi:hypothetical protein